MIAQDPADFQAEVGNLARVEIVKPGETLEF
jgi:hypothetical protein